MGCGWRDRVQAKADAFVGWLESIKQHEQQGTGICKGLHRADVPACSSWVSVTEKSTIEEVELSKCSASETQLISSSRPVANQMAEVSTD